MMQYTLHMCTIIRRKWDFEVKWAYSEYHDNFLTFVMGNFYVPKVCQLKLIRWSDSSKSLVYLKVTTKPKWIRHFLKVLMFLKHLFPNLLKCWLSKWNGATLKTKTSKTDQVTLATNMVAFTTRKRGGLSGMDGAKMRYASRLLPFL